MRVSLCRQDWVLILVFKKALTLTLPEGEGTNSLLIKKWELTPSPFGRGLGEGKLFFE